MGLLPDGEAGGDLLVDQLVQLLQLDAGFPDADGLHAASDVHPDQVGRHLIGDGHGGPDGAAFAGVDVRHQADAAACREFLVAELLHLRDGGAVHYIGKDFSFAIFAFDFNHIFLTILSVDGACQKTKNRGGAAVPA